MTVTTPGQAVIRPVGRTPNQSVCRQEVRFGPREGLASARSVSSPCLHSTDLGPVEQMLQAVVAGLNFGR